MFMWLLETGRRAFCILQTGQRVAKRRVWLLQASELDLRRANGSFPLYAQEQGSDTSIIARQETARFGQKSPDCRGVQFVKDGLIR
jgi:hypothetical protein